MDTNYAHAQVDLIRQSVRNAHQKAISTDIETKNQNKSFEKLDGKLISIKKAINKMTGIKTMDGQTFSYRRPPRTTYSKNQSPGIHVVIGDLNIAKAAAEKFRSDVSDVHWSLTDSSKNTKKSFTGAQKGLFKKVIGDFDALIAEFPMEEAGE